MLYPLSGLEFEVVSGHDIPKEAKFLTRGDKGVMVRWLQHRRDRMVACLAYKGNTLVGWSAILYLGKEWVIIGKDVIEIGTFVHPDLRGNKVGKDLVTKLLKIVSALHPKAIIKYGAPDDSYYFNKTYESLFTFFELIPFKYPGLR